MTVSSKNQIVVPSAVRRVMAVKSGDRLVVSRLTATEVVLKKEPSFHTYIGVVPKGPEDPVKRIRAVRDDWR